MPLIRLICVAVIAAMTPLISHAADVCNLPTRHGVSDTAKAIVRAACEEHRLWGTPLIDTAGRIARLGPTETDSESLADDGVVAWQRVARYWRDSGTLGPMSAIAGAQSCAAPFGQRLADSDCRAFIADNPWSAAFVSWVMTRAGLEGFKRSPRHIDYIRAASTAEGGTPYQLRDISTAKPAPGDLVCFLRNRGKALSFTGLASALADNTAVHWPSHCEVVVAANPGGDRTLYLIGGNVANTVMLRRLPLSRTGVIEPPPPLPVDIATAGCGLTNEEGCNFNRQDWAALLKLSDAATSAATSLPVTTPAVAAGDNTELTPENPPPPHEDAGETPINQQDSPAR